MRIVFPIDKFVNDEGKLSNIERNSNDDSNLFIYLEEY